MTTSRRSRTASPTPPKRLNGSPKIRIVGHANVSPTALIAHPDNWRVHPDYQKAILKGSINEIGWTKSIQVQHGTGVIVDGHARVAAAIDQGWAEVPVEYVDLSDAEVRKALAALDAIAGLADADYEALQRTLASVTVQNDPLSGLFDDLEAQARDALAMAKQYEGRDKTNFHSVQKAFSERKVVLKAVFALDEAELVERALEATGKINRAEALQVLAKHYLESHDGHSADELDGVPEARVAQDLARALGGPQALRA